MYMCVCVCVCVRMYVLYYIHIYYKNIDYCRGNNIRISNAEGRMLIEAKPSSTFYSLALEIRTVYEACSSRYSFCYSLSY